ncbi:MAG: CDP-alcohol phosphatidyltransferase family protein [Anaerolineae bacterium]|nr:CDP-alcohol phosphatidyltransferase family protein [Anaerolineae bacterium]NUQ03734.1 CDP-alcohol phosphatidyltransferase family protein [Anaerolineae bacterium]
MPELPPPRTLSDRARALTAGLTQRAGAAMVRLGIHPDTITLVGLLVVALGAYFISVGSLQAGGIILLLSLPLDALDGATARAMRRVGQFGAVLDSTLDRYADGLIFGGFILYFARLDNETGILLSLASLAGSFVVSYVRARAGEAGLSVKIGWFSRFERVVVLLLALLVPPLLWIGLWVLAVGTNLTAIQRIWYVFKHLKEA